MIKCGTCGKLVEADFIEKHLMEVHFWNLD